VEEKQQPSNCVVYGVVLGEVDATMLVTGSGILECGKVMRGYA